MKKTIKHGHRNHIIASPTYNSWRKMKDRCNNSNADNYQFYGARGIKVCLEWDKFENFLADMGIRPENLTLDRIDPNKGYYKENCRWATAVVQGKNKRKK